MRAFLILIAAMFFGAAQADMVYQSGDLTVRISVDECKNKDIAAFINQQIPGNVGAATVTYQGRDYMACWAPITDAVVIVDESGDGGFLPMDQFKPAG